MTSIADGSVVIQTSAESAPSTPSWFGEVVLIAAHLRTHEILTKITVQVRFARRRFGRYEVIDFFAVLFGYARSFERTLEEFYTSLQRFAVAFMAPLSECGFSLPLLLSLKILRDWWDWRHYLIAQALQTPNQLPLDFAMICMPRKEGFPFLVIFLARFHHLILDHQNALTYRQGRSFTPSPFFEATIAFSQVRMRLPHTMSGLDQSRAQIPIAFSRPSTQLLPCTLFLSWTVG